MIWTIWETFNFFFSLIKVNRSKENYMEFMDYPIYIFFPVYVWFLIIFLILIFNFVPLNGSLMCAFESSSIFLVTKYLLYVSSCPGDFYFQRRPCCTRCGQCRRGRGPWIIYRISLSVFLFALHMFVHQPPFICSFLLCVFVGILTCWVEVLVLIYILIALHYLLQKCQVYVSPRVSGRIYKLKFLSEMRKFLLL